MDNHAEEQKKEIKKSLHALEFECLREKNMTAKHLEKLNEDLMRVNFRKERMDFVTDMLREFDILDPSALDTIFEYKSEDAKE